MVGCRNPEPARSEKLSTRPSRAVPERGGGRGRGSGWRACGKETKGTKVTEDEEEGEREGDGGDEGRGQRRRRRKVRSGQVVPSAKHTGA